MRRTFPPQLPALPRDLHRIAHGGAWLFAIGSLFPLLWLGNSYNTSGGARVFDAQINGIDHGVWGLTYDGIFGAMLLWTQILAVIAANVLTLLPNNRLRRIGHVFFAIWAAWWMTGAMYLTTIEPWFWSVQSIFQTALFLCVSYRAIGSWNQSPRWPARFGGRGESILENREGLPLTPNDIQSSPRITELHVTQGNRSRSTLPPESTTPTRASIRGMERQRVAGLCRHLGNQWHRAGGICRVVADAKRGHHRKH